MQILAFQPIKQFNQLSDLFTLHCFITGCDGGFHTGSRVVFEYFALGTQQGGFHCLYLMQHVDAVALFFEHAYDAANLAFDAAQSFNGW